jgi:Ca-activated chloride channel family protein
MRTTITLDHQTELPGLHRVRALARVQANGPASDTRTPLNLALVLDRSGSMAGAKLDAAREAAASLVRRLRPEDFVSVVAYDDRVMTIAGPATGSEQADLPRRIQCIQSGRTTNLSGGWLRGRELVARGRADGTLSRILLLTDGLANVGITRPAELIGLCAAARAEGITTTTLGFGADYDERLLAEMADAGGGATYYIETPEQAPAVFTEEIAGLLEVAAQNLTLTVRPADASRITVIHHSYPRAEVDAAVRFDLGDLYAREPKSLLAEFLVEVRDPSLLPVDVAEVTVSADVRNVEGGIDHVELKLSVQFSPTEGATVDPEIRREVLFFEAARARREAMEKQERGDLDGARDTLHEAAMCLSADAAFDPEVNEEVRDLGAMADLFDANRVQARDLKYLQQRAYNQARAVRKKSELIARLKKDRSLKDPDGTP